MPSPFPGMDPYLEASYRWQDFHTQFLVSIREVLVPKVRPRYSVHIERYVSLMEWETGEEVAKRRPDVTITEGEPLAPATSGVVATTVQTLESVIITTIPIALAEFYDERHYYLEVRELTTQKAVTVIELLSPFNKQAGSGRDEYLQQRNDVLQGDVHLIELDLLRAGKRMPMGKPLPDGDYHVIVSKADKRPIADVYSWTIRQPLPTIPVPLAGDDPDVPLNLQEVLNIVYDQAGYDYTLPYEQEPDPPLRPEDTEWAREILSKVVTR